MKKKIQKMILAYIPVIHQGYLNFFERHKDATTLYILGESFKEMFTSLDRDVRAVRPQSIKKILDIVVPQVVAVIEVKDNHYFFSSPSNLREEIELVVPDEYEMREIAEKHIKNEKIKIVFDSVFLRWDRQYSVKAQEISPDISLNHDAYDESIMGLAFKEAKNSPDWWRQVGAVLVGKDKKPMFVSYNEHLPYPMITYEYGDPRSGFNAGENTDLSFALHAEAGIIALAAKKGISLEGTAIYSSTFPCPGCARLIAKSGIKKVYFSEGYSLVGAYEVFKTFGIEMILVDPKLIFK